MKRISETCWKSCRNSGIWIALLPGIWLGGCDWIKLKKDETDGSESRQAVARVNTAFLYKDELNGIVSPGATPGDSASLVEGYVNSWIRKQLLIQEAARKIDIDEAELERKILDYRYSIIAYEYQSFYIKQNLDTVVSRNEIEAYYENNKDNFILKQNIVRATFIKVPKNAPRTEKIKNLIFSEREQDKNELKSYCLSFSSAYHISDSLWMVYDELVKKSPLMEIPNKIQFLQHTPYYETSDDNYLYFLKVDEYRITDNVSPLDFVDDEIRNIMLNKRKVELARKLEDVVYQQAQEKNEFEIIK
jgi:CHAT domain-containing protein